MSFVCTQEDAAFLRERYIKLNSVDLFKDMEWSEDKAQIKEWISLHLRLRFVTLLSTSKVNEMKRYINY